jgi:hypothetical protein
MFDLFIVIMAVIAVFIPLIVILAVLYGLSWALDKWWADKH